MIEIIVERWSGPGGTEFHWSIWRDGRRVQMSGAYSDAATCEAAATEFCTRELGATADRVTHL